MEMPQTPTLGSGSAISDPASERRTYAVLNCDVTTDLDFRLPDEPDLPAGYRLQVGGQGFYERVKSSLDFVASLIILLVMGPIILLAGLLVKLTSKGSVLYTQVRLGQDGKPYVIYKLRSMYQDCEKSSGIRWCTQGDCRITPVGKWLRKLHLDELPQLWNVLRGEMSLIGPRPERPELVVSLERALPRYRDRLLVKPGLTGLAQVQLPPDTNLESVKAKLALDRVYVNRRGFWLDTRIALGTILYLVGVTFATIGRWLRLPNEVRQETAPTVEVRYEAPRSKSNPFRTVPVLE